MINKILHFFGYKLKRIQSPQREPFSRDYEPETLEIKKLILQKKLKQTEIAKSLGVSDSLVSQAISSRPDKMPLLRKKIYEYLKSL